MFDPFNGHIKECDGKNQSITEYLTIRNEGSNLLNFSQIISYFTYFKNIKILEFYFENSGLINKIELPNLQILKINTK